MEIWGDPTFDNFLRYTDYGTKTVDQLNQNQNNHRKYFNNTRAQRINTMSTYDKRLGCWAFVCLFDISDEILL